MTMDLNYHCQKADTNDVLAHLKRCDSKFIPTLSSRLDIENYARKITSNAQTFEAWDNDEMVGLIAIYSNSTDRLRAFITSVSVLPDWHGKGIANQLLKNCILSMRNLGFKYIELEVVSRNEAAVALYLKYGFTITGCNDNLQKMIADLTKEN